MGKHTGPNRFAAMMGWMGAAMLWLAAGLRADNPSVRLGENSGQADPLGAATLVVFNKNDLFSAEIAATYAAARRIPAEQVVGIPCATTEEITRAEYDLTLAEPLRREFVRNGWWRVASDGSGERVVVENKIRFIALIRGIPLKIAATQGYPGDLSTQPPPIGNRNEAAVDSELSILGRFTQRISGPIENPYYRRFAPILDADLPGLMLVCRLDAPTPQAVHRMIADSLRAEREGLYGFCYADLRGIREPGLSKGDEWILKAAEEAQHHGFPVVADSAEAQFATAYPMRDVALYFGWYSENLEGPVSRADFAFRPGAVAAHIHSFSAGTLRDPARNWAGGLVERGAAATLGNVYEPYLGLTNDLGLFAERLRCGMTFAEACYQSVVALSWMNTFVGDPLYRPFRLWNDVLAAPDKVPDEWLAYRKGAIAWFDEGRQVGERMLKAKAAGLKSGLIWEGLGLLQAGARDLPAAYSSFARARAAYRSEEAIIRCILHEVNLLRFSGKKKESLALVRKSLQAHPKAAAAAVLKAIEWELDPPPTPTPSPAASPLPGTVKPANPPARAGATGGIPGR